MRGEKLTGQGYVGKITAIGMEAFVEDQRRPGKAKALSCAGG
jgi:hypothetical protein